MNSDERRWKLLSVNPQDIMTMLIGWQIFDVIRLPIFQGLPEGFSVHNVNFDYHRECFVCCIEHESFPPTRVGEHIPFINDLASFAYVEMDHSHERRLGHFAEFMRKFTRMEILDDNTVPRTGFINGHRCTEGELLVAADTMKVDIGNIPLVKVPTLFQVDETIADDKESRFLKEAYKTLAEPSQHEPPTRKPWEFLGEP
jgi:hypothetical protein